MFCTDYIKNDANRAEAMVKYKATSITAKKGVNFVRSLVEDAGCLFHKIEQENDLGIDALIEIVNEERPLNKQIAAQIRSGPSYYDSISGECFFRWVVTMTIGRIILFQ